MSESHLCSHCGAPHVVQKPHKEHLTKIKAEMLRAAALHVIDTQSNDFKKKDVPGMKENSAYGNFQKLRYHGLIAQVKVNGVKQRDRWLVTRLGWMWLRGEARLAKWVWVQNNHLAHTPDLPYGPITSFVTTLKGGDYLETKFEYFDEESGQIVMRPGQPQDQQGALL